jgi:hypothetical protein
MNRDRLPGVFAGKVVAIMGNDPPGPPRTAERFS